MAIQRLRSPSAAAVDYDANNNDLIDVNNLAQLDAIRYDGNGDGIPVRGAGAVSYLAAFPGLTRQMGCPNACAGYELGASLDFDTTGNDDRADAPYANWTPIGTYTSTFRGNAHTISNLNVSSAAASARLGLFAELGSGGRITAVGLINPTVRGTGGAQESGALAGRNRGTISAAYATGGSVAGSGSGAVTGGLVGRNNGALRASYATTAVNSGAGSGGAGGLAGRNDAGTITASYAASAVSGGAGTRCLSDGGNVHNSYYDSTLCAHTGGAGTGQATADLKSPIDYTGIYAGWNLNLNGAAGGDDPWDFGTGSEYPALKYRPFIDYDTDDDNLIDISNLAQLNAMRHDGNGDGDAGHAEYAAAYPSRQTAAAGRMGCPGACTGYELRNDLDFDTQGDDDVADGPYANWTPIRNYGGVFQGNNHTISNLTSNAAASIQHVGLFGTGGPTISGVGLANASVTGASDTLRAGALIGELSAGGLVTASWATGRVTSTSTGSGAKSVGGLVGRAAAPVRASYADVRVTASQATTATTVSAGGLVGRLNGGAVTAGYATGAVAGGGGATSYAGGLVGQLSGAAHSIAASYATGTAASTASGVNAGGLAGNLPGGATIANSYWDTDSSGIADADLDASAGEGKTTGELQMPTDYATRYATDTYFGWDVNVDGDTGTGDSSGNDDPWHFGTNAQYPALQFGGLDTFSQFDRQPTTGTLNTLTVLPAALPAFHPDTLAYTATLPAGSTAPTVTVATRADRDSDTVSISATIGGGPAVTHDGDAGAAGYQVALGSPSTVITITVTPNSGPARSYVVTIPTAATDYDIDNDNLIDVSNLAQLNAIRYDLNGDGVVDDAANSALHAVGYPRPPARMGCAATCTGYELVADLDFDTSGDGAVTGADAYPNWTPIAPYTGNFEGNNYTIANMTINATNTGRVGLFGSVAGAIEGVGLTGVAITTSYTSIQPSLHQVGGLVGFLDGTVRDSYATGTITTTASGTAVSWVGGLVGTTRFGSSVSASYAAVNVTANSTSTSTLADSVGGLAGVVGGNNDNPGTLAASYATGAVAANRAGANVGGLAGSVGQVAVNACYATGAVTGSTSATRGLFGAISSSATITNSYWDITTTGVPDDGGNAAPEGVATSGLKSPTGYTGIYTGWNVNLDTGGADNPWNFGTNAQYPILQYDRDARGVQQQRSPGATAVDYDFDNDNLIDIDSLAKLNALRYDSDGDGISNTGADALSYLAVFPGVSSKMGCPDGCAGYELVVSLDFDGGTAGDRTDDEFSNGSAGWIPLRYSGVLQGNGHTLSNLYINASPSVHHVGLFGQGTPRVSGVGLPNVSITGASNGLKAGALIGTLYAQGGLVTSSWATGSVTSTNSDGNEKSVGGLVGINFAPIRASYADVTVTASTDATATTVNAGGLVGKLPYGSITASYATGTVTGGGGAASYAGGLAGQLESGTTPSITASYATGTATSTASSVNVGGLAGNLPSDATIANSYWDTDTSGIADADPSTSAGEGKTTGELQGPTAYGSGSYANWNRDIDGDGNPDDPWYFGGNTQYPVLQYGRLTALTLSPAMLSAPLARSTFAYDATLPADATSPTATVVATAARADAEVSISAVAGAGSAVIADAYPDTPGHQVVLRGPSTVIAVTVVPYSGAAQRYVVTVAVPETDYDTDDNNLIDVTSLAQLDAIRYDLNGDGALDDAANRIAYAAAYPIRAADMGCPDGCAGYELLLDLDFDTTGSDGVADGPYANWTPIGTDAAPFSGKFQGNGNDIANLNVNAGADVVTVGLFGTASGAITGVGLRNAKVAGARDNLAMGALVGTLQGAGTVTSGWATGRVTASNPGSAAKFVGGLVGYNAGAVRASYADVTVTATTTATALRAGGLIGSLANTR